MLLSTCVINVTIFLLRPVRFIRRTVEIWRISFFSLFNVKNVLLLSVCMTLHFAQFVDRVFFCYTVAATFLHIWSFERRSNSKLCKHAHIRFLRNCSMHGKREIKKNKRYIDLVATMLHISPKFAAILIYLSRSISFFRVTGANKVLRSHRHYLLIALPLPSDAYASVPHRSQCSTVISERYLKIVHRLFFFQ